MDDSRGVLKQSFIGEIGLECCCGEKDQGSIGKSALQTVLDIRPQVVLLAKPLAEVLRFLAVHIEQTDLVKLPVSKEEPLDGCAGDYPSPDYAKASFKGIERICSAANAAEAPVRVALISDASIQARG